MLRFPVAIASGLCQIGRKPVKGLIPGHEILGCRGHQILFVFGRHGLLQDETVVDLLRQPRDAGVVSGDQRREDVLAGLFDRQHLLAQQIAQLRRQIRGNRPRILSRRWHTKSQPDRYCQRNSNERELVCLSVV